MIQAASAAVTAEAVFSTRFLTRGEAGEFDIVVQGMPPGTSPDHMPSLPEVKNLTIEPVGPAQPRRARDGSRRVELVFPYRISSYVKGRYVIPAAEINVGGEKIRTSPSDIEILDDMSLQRQEAIVGGQTIGYSAFFHATKPNPYVGEKIPVELKVYFPFNQRVQDWGIPDFERDGLSAWRFQPQQGYYGGTRIGAREYAVVSYPSTLSANREGKIRIGPATLRIQTYQPTTGNDEAVDLQIPALELEARPLPLGAPESFENAIGHFSLDVSIAENEVHEGDPISATLTVTGSGNLDTLHPPKPLQPEGWKLYDAIPNQRGDERRDLSGTVSFTQLMRPTRLQASVPAFTFSYFDPSTDRYETIISNPLPLKVLPSTAPPSASQLATPPKAMAVPVEQMTDILGAIPNPKALLPASRPLPRWAWQIVPAVIALGLLMRISILHFAQRVRRDPDSITRDRELRDVESAPEERAAFYRAVGHFVERWLGNRQDPEVVELLGRRDEVAFRPEAAAMKVEHSERSQVLKTLKKLALPLLVVGCLLVPQQSRAADPAEAQKAFEESRYGDAAKLWLESGPYDRLSGDTLYNIGESAYRLGAPGEAALYFRRAIARDGSHLEARQNLRFLERKFGSVTSTRNEYQETLATLSQHQWRNLVYAGGWVLVIGLLIFASGFRNAFVRTGGVLALCFSPLAFVLGGAALHYYPDDARFAPLEQQMVVLSDQATVRTDAARNAPQVIVAPAGSLCRLVTRSGAWDYIEFANETHSRGWVPHNDIAPLIPTSPPEPPKVHPNSAPEGSNA